jgi:MFS family permease
VIAESATPARATPRVAYKWIALSNTTLGMLMAGINQSILLIALPDIFRGIHLDPLAAGNSGYLLWMIMGNLVVTAVLVVSIGRLADIHGRVRLYNLGFAVFTLFSLLLSVTWMQGAAGGLWLIVMRIGQGVGGAMLFATTAAILTDAFPPTQRGVALGINATAAMSGTFIGLALGGILAPASWRLVFLVSVPIGLFGTAWAYYKLRELSPRRPAKIDWWGNLTFAAGLILVMIGITYGIRPYGGHAMGWTNPFVLGSVAAGSAVLAAFVLVERRVEAPMFRLELFRIRAFSAGSVATFLAAMARGGLQLTIVVWLQGIWLPLHGFAFSRTPFWAGLAMLPLVAGFLVAGPASGWLSDKYGARPFATGGMVLSTLAFALFLALPVNFSYPELGSVLFLEGLGMGMFTSPNRAGVMNSLPPGDRGAGGGMNLTFQNSATVLSIGVFFTLMVLGLAATLPAALNHGLAANGVAAADASRISSLPPVSTLFASFLGYNPVGTLLGPHVLGGLTTAQQARLTGRSFFPQLISGPFHTALVFAFGFAIAACAVSAFASLARGPRFHWTEPEPAAETA